MDFSKSIFVDFCTWLPAPQYLSVADNKERQPCCSSASGGVSTRHRRGAAISETKF